MINVPLLGSHRGVQAKVNLSAKKETCGYLPLFDGEKEYRYGIRCRSDFCTGRADYQSASQAQVWERIQRI